MNPDEIDAAIAFFDTAGGQALLAYETAARRAMADPEVEAIARAAYDQQRRNRDARFDAVARFVAVNDLVERNVAGTLGATFHFLRGMSDGGGLDWSEAEILDDVWADEEETRRDTASWIHGFLLMAYRPLDLAELDAYVTFSGTDAGQALNAALFDGFESIYADISHARRRGRWRPAHCRRGLCAPNPRLTPPCRTAISAHPGRNASRRGSMT
jgi:hypothetical protein